MLLKFHCPKCSIDFHIESKNMGEKESLCCPNCEFPYPQEHFLVLREAVVKFDSSCKPDAEYTDKHGHHLTNFWVEPYPDSEVVALIMKQSPRLDV